MTTDVKVSKATGGKAAKSVGGVRELKATPHGTAVRVELPWIRSTLGEGARLTQIVLEQHADAVEQAIEQYMEYRGQAVKSAAAVEDLTMGMWRLLQAAHPHPLFQWFDWEEERDRFNSMVTGLLSGSRAA